MDEPRLELNDVIGNLGCYHAIVIALAVFRAITIGCMIYASAFIAPNVPHECAPPDGINETIWRIYAEPSKCSVVPLNAIYDGLSFHRPNTSVRPMPCEHGWNYNMDGYSRTTTSEWNLVCNDAWQRSGIQWTILTGALCGVVLIGKLSDTFGRKITFFTSLLVASIAATVGAFASSLIWFGICSLILAACTIGQTAALLPLLAEILPKRNRALIILAFSIAYFIPIKLLKSVSLPISDFRNALLALAVALALLLLFYPLIFESPKWLLSKGKIDESMESIRQIIYRSNQTVPDVGDKMVQLAVPFTSQTGIATTKCNWTNLKTVIIFSSSLILWFCNSLSYRIIFANERAAFDYYLEQTLPVEVIAAIFCIWACGVFPRRTIQIVALGGVLLSHCISLFIPTGASAVLTIVLTRSFHNVVTFTQLICITEYFPTPIRSTGVALCLMSSLVGVKIAQFIVNLGGDEYHQLENGMFFAAIFAQLICIAILPETFGEPLPDSLEDLQNIMRSTRLFKPETNMKLKSFNYL